MDEPQTIYDLYTECPEMFEFFQVPQKELSSSSQNWEGVITKHIKRMLIQPKGWRIDSFGEGLTWLNTSVPLDLDYELKNKVVVLEFFTYCCINCEHVFPIIQHVEEKYKTNSELVVIGVHSPKHPNERDSNSVIDALKRNNISHPVINDFENKLWNILNINCWPTVLILGPDQKVLFSLIGETAISKLDFICQVTLEYLHISGIDLNTMILPVEHKETTDKRKSLLYPSAISCSSEYLIVSDTSHNRLLLMTFDGKVLNIIGDGSKGHVDGSFEKCSFNSPHGSDWWDSNVLIADTGNNSIRLIDMQKRIVLTVFNGNESHINSTSSQSGTIFNEDKETIKSFKSPWDICIGPSLEKGSDAAYIAVAGSHQIWVIHLEANLLFTRQFSSFTCSPFAGNGKEECRNNFYRRNAGFAQPTGICYSGRGSCFVVDSESSSLRSISLQQGSVQTIVGGDRNPSELFCFGDVDGISPHVKFQHPLGICVFSSSKVLITDSYNHKIKIVDVELCESDTFAGTGVKGNLSDVSKLKADFNEPSGICYAQNIGRIFVTDTNNHCVKLINLEDWSVKLMDIIFPNSTCIDGPTLKRRENRAHYRKVKLQSGGKITCTFLLHRQGMKLTEGAPQPWSVTLNGNCNWSVSCLSSNIVNTTEKPSLVLQCENDRCETFCTLAIKIDFSTCDDQKKVCLPRQECVYIGVELCKTGSKSTNVKLYF